MKDIDFKSLLIDDAMLYNGDKFNKIITNTFGENAWKRIGNTITWLVSAVRDGQSVTIDGVTYFAKDYPNNEGTNLGLLINMGALIISAEYADLVKAKDESVIIDGKSCEAKSSEMLTPEELQAFWERYASWQKISYQVTKVSKHSVTIDEIYGIYPIDAEVKDENGKAIYETDSIYVINREARYPHEAIYWKDYRAGFASYCKVTESNRNAAFKLWLLKGLNP